MNKANNKYIEELHRIIASFKEIDSETPWQEAEPEWWLDMMEIWDLIKQKIEKEN